jgi:hypothetical protein
MKKLQQPNQSNVHNLYYVRCEDSRHFRNKQEGKIKAKICDLESNSKIKNIADLYRGINDFRKGYHPRTNMVKDEKGDLITDSHSTLVRWRNHSYQPLNLHGVNDDIKIYCRATSAKAECL